MCGNTCVHRRMLMLSSMRLPMFSRPCNSVWLGHLEVAQNITWMVALTPGLLHCLAIRWVSAVHEPSHALAPYGVVANWTSFLSSLVLPCLVMLRSFSCCVPFFFLSAYARTTPCWSKQGAFISFSYYGTGVLCTAERH